MSIKNHKKHKDHLTPHLIIPGLLLGAFMIFIGRPLAVLVCLLPFRSFTLKARLYISWVGLRGAVPIIFATMALASPDVLHARFMFNMVFFITIISLLFQGTTVTWMAGILGLKEDLDERKFNFDLPDEITASMKEIQVKPSLLADGHMLREITLPPDTLVILVRRGQRYLVPTGNTKLFLGDTLLVISEQEKHLTEIISEK